MEVLRKEIIIPRKLWDKENLEVDAQSEFERLYEGVFNEITGEKATVINISTTFNDYKKIHDDLKKSTVKWKEKTRSISAKNSIDDLVEINALRKFCCKKKKIRNSKVVLALKIGEAVIPFLTFFQIIFDLLTGKELLDNGDLLVLSILGMAVLYFTIMLFHKKQNEECIRIMEGWETEGEIIEFLGELEYAGCKIDDEGIFFVENLSRLDRLCRCYIIAYLHNIGHINQLWCIFDYLFESTVKVEDVNKRARFVKYRLQPLQYKEKEKLYKEYSLHNNICKEYLNCIGVDILWAENFEIGCSNYKLHSLNYIQDKLEKIEGKNKYGKMLMGFFYCILYINIKFQYSFSIEQMAKLYRKAEDVELKTIIEKNSQKIGIADDIEEEEIKFFIKQLVNTLEGYYEIEEVEGRKKKYKKYKFSYDVFECFQKKREKEYLSEDDIRIWTLLKLITEKDIFSQDRYFFDCSNLLVINESLEDEEYLLLANKVLKIMNQKNCLLYYSPLLRQIKNILEERGESKVSPLEREVLEKAVANNLFYCCNDESIEIAIAFLQGNADKDEILCDFWNGDIVSREDLHQNIKEFFILPYLVIDDLVYSQLKLLQSKTVKWVEGENDLYNIYLGLMWIAVQYQKKEEVDKEIQNLYKQVKRYSKGAATKVFELVIMEMLQWIKSEIHCEKDSKYRNINVGVLIEMTGSNMLLFIYGLLNMTIIRSKDNVYRNENNLLDFVSRCVFYVDIMSRQKGNRIFVDEIICSEIPTDIKLGMLVELLARGMVWRENACKFIIANKESMLQLIRQSLHTINETRELEEFFSTLDFYTYNIKEQEFSNAVYQEIEEYLTNSEYENKKMYIWENKAILCKILPDMTLEEMISTVNQTQTALFGASLLSAYCELKPELIERLEYIKKEILCVKGSNIGLNMMQKYLLQHEFYDCNKNILEYYLEEIKIRENLHPGNVRIYLLIIDRFRKDNEGIMERELFTYNYMISLDVYYRAVELFELQKKSEIYKKKMFEFFEMLIKGLSEVGVSVCFRNQKILQYIENKKVEREDEIENIIFHEFEELNPLVEKGNEIYLLGEYIFMLQYLQEHNDFYTKLVEHEKEKGKEILQMQHLYHLIKLLIELTEEKNIGFRKESLLNIRDIVYAMCQM